jgi:energy-coupling factor transporter ATP-binding protein EcfA2
MQLKSLEYIQYEGEPEEWATEGLTLEDINLIVGKNASGKSRVLNVIKNISGVVAGDSDIYSSGRARLSFEKEGVVELFELDIKDHKVVKEKLTIGDEVVLDRAAGGQGRIKFQQEEGKMIDFQAPEGKLACLTRMDSVQHKFLEDIYLWGKSLRHYYFGTKLGQDTITAFVKDKEKSIDPKNTRLVIAMFREGQKLSHSFGESVISDMSRVGYKLDAVDVRVDEGVVLKADLPSPPLQSLSVKESDLDGWTIQRDMSQGMFRTLSLLIQLNFCDVSSSPSCILIDDIGEGLDYERSSSLIDLLMEKPSNSSTQLIMSTNDRFIMNNVPLKYWSVIERSPKKARFYNYRNAKQMFDEFDFTGLSNFDFFASRFHEAKPEA